MSGQPPERLLIKRFLNIESDATLKAAGVLVLTHRTLNCYNIFERFIFICVKLKLSSFFKFPISN